jgi:hypothetical protein
MAQTMARPGATKSTAGNSAKEMKRLVLISTQS